MNKAQELLCTSESLLLSDKVSKFGTTLCSLSSYLIKLERDLASYIKVTEILVKEVRSIRDIRLRHGIRNSERSSKGLYYRDPESVQKRWDEWCAATLSGSSPAEIARSWGVRRSTIMNAVQRKFKVDKKPVLFNRNKKPLTTK